MGAEVTLSIPDPSGAGTPLLIVRWSGVDWRRTLFVCDARLAGGCEDIQAVVLGNPNR